MGDLPYHQLIVWKETYCFVKMVYQFTEDFPKYELYGIVSQLRRASVSVLTNIVEGHAKKSINDFLRFLDIARGSVLECAVLIELSKDLKYLKQEAYQTLEGQRAKTTYLLDKFIRGVQQQRMS